MSSGRAYLASPWIEGDNLHWFLTDYTRCMGLSRTHPHANFDKVGMILQIAEGLAYLHANGIVHGDLKTSNILLDEQLKPFIGDFGSTSVTLQDTSPTQTWGTRRLQAPELMMGESKTTASDMYAFAMLIVQVVTGQVPFPEIEHEGAVILAVLRDKRPDLKAFDEDRESQILGNLAGRCWNLDSRGRLSALEVVAELGAWQMNR